MLAIVVACAGELVVFVLSQPNPDAYEHHFKFVVMLVLFTLIYGSSPQALHERAWCVALGVAAISTSIGSACLGHYVWWSLRTTDTANDFPYIWASLFLALGGVAVICWWSFIIQVRWIRTGFTLQQKQALLDLLIIGLDAEAKPASPEDKRITQLLDTFQMFSDNQRQQFFDTAFARVGRQSSSPDVIQASVTQLASHFSTGETRRRAYELLETLLTRNGHDTAEEYRLLSATKAAFKG